MTCVYVDQDFDGGGFMELSEADFKELFPRKLGTVKKLLRVQKTVCTYTYVCMHMRMYVRTYML